MNFSEVSPPAPENAVDHHDTKRYLLLRSSPETRESRPATLESYHSILWKSPSLLDASSAPNLI